MEKVFLIGIGGAGMSSLAFLAKNLGLRFLDQILRIVILLRSSKRKELKFLSAI